MPSARPASRLFSEGLLHLVFFLSGFAAILYQLVWQRSLFTIYGTSSESVTIVVTVFMLGLGIGGLLGGALSRGDRWSLPVLFGIAELLIGAFGSGSLQLFRWTALPAADARVGEENRGNLGRRDSLSERRVVDFAAERGEAPARGLRVEAEADMAGERVRVAEDSRKRSGLVDAVRARHGVQHVHGLGGEADRVGEIALEAQLRLRIRDYPAVRDFLRLEAVVAQDQARRVDLRSGRADAQLHRLEVAHLRAGVVGAALLHGGDAELQRGLRVADRARADAVPAERRERHAVGWVGVRLRPGKFVAAAGFKHAERLVLGNEDVLGDDRHAARRAHPEHLPIVDDLVLRLVQQAHAVVDRAIAVAHRDREHVPFGDVRAAREIPLSADDVAVLDLYRPPLRTGHAACAQRLRIRAPYLLLRALLVHRQHPVVHLQIAEIPGGRSAAERELVAEIDVGDEIELHPAPALGLHRAQDAARVQVDDRLRRHHAGFFGLRGAAAKRRHHGPRAADRVLVGNAGETLRALVRGVHQAATLAFVVFFLRSFEDA